MTGFTYPKEYGGQGADAWQERIYEEEAAGYEASSGFIRSTITMLGPTLMAFGTEEQKRELVPRLLSGEDAWCQLFSEPGAGSDLAEPGCRAERDGDEFIVNGQKVWTSAAQWCDHGMLLARTNPDVPKHHGITFLLVDMDARASRCDRSSRPTGAAHFNEVFFDRRPGAGRQRARRHRQRLARRADGDGERVGDDRRWWRQHVQQPAAAGAGVRPHRRPGRASAADGLLRAREGPQAFSRT